MGWGGRGGGAGAEGAQFAGGAVGFACEASASAMPDEPVAEESPRFSGNDLEQVLFDFLGGLGLGESEALGETLDMGIHDDAFRLAKDFA